LVEDFYMSYMFVKGKSCISLFSLCYSPVFDAISSIGALSLYISVGATLINTAGILPGACALNVT
jgi:hypothetical protein